ncbi:MAG: hypothetical protein U9N73_05925 [Candidatus Auribacterota bacterium]|nr:hypothetical protein [Candidatus Auribacterota bacterium]
MKNLPPPGFLKHCFWDIQFETFCYQDRPRFVIERVLEYGGCEAVRWMLEAFSRPQIINTLTKSGNISPKSANFWSNFFKIDKEKIRCLKKSFQEKRKQFWPY